MDLGTFFILMVMTGLVSYVINLIWKIDIMKLLALIGALFLIIPYIGFSLAVISAPPARGSEIAAGAIQFYVREFPSLIVEDLAGSVVGAITAGATKRRRR